MSETTTIVIFGASGDLTKRKLIPALYNLYLKGRLPEDYVIVGNSRSEYSHEEFREKMRDAMKEFAQSYGDASFNEFASRMYYLPGNVKDVAFYNTLNNFLGDKESDNPNRLYYLSTAPFLYEPILEKLGESGLNRSDIGWRRIVIEKPFGYDLETATQLNDHVHETFEEDQVYRIDHYLGKETAQNLMFFRFANTIFEPIWNRNYIDHVQITVAESVDVGRRAEYYDTSGVLRDMFQNHLLQLLALTAMEPPSSFEADALRNEKVKVLQAIKPIPLEDIVVAQYDGYCELEGVAEDSITPTYAALQLEVGNWRWEGVPFYLRSGKALERKTSEITVVFKDPPHMMFQREHINGFNPNKLTICIQPDEGISLGFEAKLPDTSQETRTVHMDFGYAQSFGECEIPDAYERLLLDAVMGDAALFSRGDEIEAQWRIIDHVIESLSGEDAPPVAGYTPNSWGPTEADALLARSGNEWTLRCGHSE
jgi:glucose-6-phosphate 1-dehydrogenase